MGKYRVEIEIDIEFTDEKDISIDDIVNSRDSAKIISHNIVNPKDKPKVKYRYELHTVTWKDKGYGVDRTYTEYDIYDNYLQKYILYAGDEHKRTLSLSNDINDFGFIIDKNNREKLYKAGMTVNMGKIYE